MKSSRVVVFYLAATACASGPDVGAPTGGKDAATPIDGSAPPPDSTAAAPNAHGDATTPLDGGAPLRDSGSKRETAALNACDGAAPSSGTPVLVAGQWKNISPPGLYRPRGTVPSYGCMDIHVLRCSPNTLYLTTDSAGIWRSNDGGSTWKQIGDLPAPTSPGVMAIDPNDPNNMYYGGGVRGPSLGFWVSTDAGNTWTEPAGFTAKANNSVGGWTNDVYVVTPDPADFKHVLLTFHSGFEFKADAGVLESMDGGESWVRHDPEPGWGAGHSLTFLGASGTWLLGTQGDGHWRTTDSGRTWTRVSTQSMQHGGEHGFVSKTGVLYIPAVNSILRSTDNGETFSLVGPSTQDGFYDIVGDGNFLYAQAANTGANSTTDQPFITSPESDGTTWTPYNDQKFSDGPYRMTFDAVNRIIYAANWNDGVWALKVVR